MRMQQMHWSAAYVGLPYRDHGRDRAGLDCWGLVRLVYREQRGLALPSYAECYADAAERADISAALAAGAGAGPWRRVDRGAEWDVALFGAAWGACHVGVLIDRCQVLHVSAEHAARVQPLAHPLLSRRLACIYRYAP